MQWRENYLLNFFYVIKIFEDLAAKRSISGLLVACKYLKDCKWTGELRAINVRTII